ncbi:MAG: alpha/beta hydrolase [Bacteroidota bacterium]
MKRRGKISLITALLLVILYGGFRLYFANWKARQRAHILASDHIQLPLGSLHYRVTGSGSPVLYLHGGGGGHDEGLPLSHCSLIVPSRPGYLQSDPLLGESYEASSQAYLHLLDSLALPQVALVAFSAGGPPALSFAKTYPNRVSCLVLISVVSDGSKALSPQKESLRRWTDRWLGEDFLDWYYSQALAWFPEKMMLEGPEALLSPIDQAYLAKRPATLAAMVEDYQSRAGASSLRWPGFVQDRQRYPTLALDSTSFPFPTLILHGDVDQSVSFEQAQSLAQRIQPVRLVTIPGGGHLSILARQDSLMPLIADFIHENQP